MEIKIIFRPGFIALAYVANAQWQAISSPPAAGVEDLFLLLIFLAPLAPQR
jgi:hypothetical protein